ncbi:MAG: hypothetical protein K1X61_11880 [Chitinophagales bacterium]|nr:hypothetical protein [Chitinophagales bacterium]
MDKALRHSATSLFASLLKKVRDKELREFMETYAAQNKSFETAFLLKFADRLKISGKDKFQLLIQQIIADDEANGGYITTVAARLDTLLLQAADQLASKNYLDPFHLAVVLIEFVHPLLGRHDDPELLLQQKVIAAFSLLDDIMHADAGPQLKELIFETALQQALKDEYRHSGVADDWINLLLDGAANEEQQYRILSLLEQLITASGKLQKSAVNERYEEFFLRKKIQLLEKMGRVEEAHLVMEGNLRIKAFRRQLIDEYIMKKDFAAAKELLKESKRSEMQKGRLYSSSEWDILILKIALLENDQRTIRQTGLRLFYDRFNIEYYRHVKSTYESEKWAAEVEKIISSLKAETHFGLPGFRALAAIYTEEKYWPRLLALVQKNASLEFVETYYDLLKDRFPQELADIYRVALRRYAEQNMGREHYEYMVKMLRKIQSLPTGISIAKSLTNEFKVKYSNRRNMVKALNKLVF